MIGWNFLSYSWILVIQQGFDKGMVNESLTSSGYFSNQNTVDLYSWEHVTPYTVMIFPYEFDFQLKLELKE